MATQDGIVSTTTSQCECLDDICGWEKDWADRENFIFDTRNNDALLDDTET